MELSFENTKHLCACEDTFNTSATPWLSLGCLNDKGEDTVQGLTGANQYHADRSAVECRVQNEIRKQ